MDRCLRLSQASIPGLSYNDERSKPEILSRIAQTTTALKRLKPVWNDMSISLSSKIRLVRSLVTSIFLYACESWTLTASPCQDPAGNWTTRRPPDDRKERQTAEVWSCFPFIRSGQNHFARHGGRGKKTRRTKEEVGRQHQGMNRPGVRQVPEGSGEQEKMEETGCEIICGAPTALRG